MSSVTGDVLVLPLADATAELARVGGKGASLARLARNGLPVPPGFHVTTDAYRAFVAQDGLRQRILAAVAEVHPDVPESLERASAAIAGEFDSNEPPAATAEAIRAAYASLPRPRAVAVRSSATAEDLLDMSFAGQQDSFLNVTGFDELLRAVKRCWASLWTARAIGYRARCGIPPDDVALAVLVQQLVPAEAAGVLFTANPLTGARDELVIDAVWGLGESLVGGRVTPDTYILAHGSRTIRSRQINDKTVRTVRDPRGTSEQPVPERWRRVPVVDEQGAAELAELGERIQASYGIPMDIEWTLHDGSFQIVQARPITKLPEAREDWNDTLLGDFLWTRGNVGEAFPEVMTPATWSLVKVLAPGQMAGMPMSGNIGGRYYLNLTVSSAAATALGLGGMMRRASEQTFGRVPAGMRLPAVPESRLKVLRGAAAAATHFLRFAAAYRKRLPRLLAGNPQRCLRAHEDIARASRFSELRELWRRELDDLLVNSCAVFDAGARQAAIGKIGARLRELVGEADANALLTGLHSEHEQLVSLGPVLGLTQLKRAEISRAEYVRTWGHRCANEFEISRPRPAEDPEWLDEQLASVAVAGSDPDELLRCQASAREQAWQRLRQRYPRKLAGIDRKLARAARAARARERARSEMVRSFWVFRAFVLRAGELTGHGEDLFFLSIDEIVAVLDGDEAPLATTSARKAAYARYRALPPYPTLIRGRFDPEAWAADENRRTDVYDETARHDSSVAGARGGRLSGFAGAAGVVDGYARVIDDVDTGAWLHTGEILVTTVTNVGWTPLFPKAAAVVTDIGAPLSHAAIVARELGIPAVVGCGDATTRIRTGDRIRVDGGAGTVTPIPSEDQSS